MGFPKLNFRHFWGFFTPPFGKKSQIFPFFNYDASPKALDTFKTPFRHIQEYNLHMSKTTFTLNPDIVQTSSRNLPLRKVYIYDICYVKH